MLYACGSNGNGQLGLGHLDDMDTWTPVEINNRVVDLAGGGNHTAVITGEGSALITINSAFVPIAHPESRLWRLVSATWDSTYLVDDDCIYKVSGSSATFLYKADSTVLSIKSGLAHTVFLTKSGLFGFGKSRKGQCGIEKTDIELPNKFELTGVVQFACGRDFTAVITKDKTDLLIFGNKRWFPEPIACTNSSTILSTWSSLLVLPEEEFVGNNSHNQLEPPISLSNCDAVALGSEHGLALKNNTVYTWGWGEHGNCPPQKQFTSSAPLLPITLFAGCATSFVQVD